MYLVVTSLLIAIISYLWYCDDYQYTIGGLFQHENARRWIENGRYLNYNGYAIFYKDVIGEYIYSNKSALLLKSNMNDDLINIAKKPIVLFLHGFPSFSYDFAGLYHHLEDEYHVVAFDMLGFGVSDKPNDVAYTFDLQANITEELISSIMNERRIMLSQFMDNEYPPEINIIAHDYGVSTAQELLSRQYLNISSLYRINSVLFLNGGLFPETHRPTIMQKILLNKYTGPVVQYASNYKLFSKSLNEVFGEFSKLSSEEAHLYYDSVCYKGGKSIMHRLIQYIHYRRLNREVWLEALIEMNKKLPIRLVNGPADPVSGIHLAVRYRELLNVDESESDVLILHQSIGHYPQLEDPKTVNLIVREWLYKNCLSRV